MKILFLQQVYQIPLTTGPFTTTTRRKESHKEVERRRRNIINEGYENLRNALIAFEEDALDVSFEGIEEDLCIYKTVGDKIRRLSKGRLLELAARYLTVLKARISSSNHHATTTTLKNHFTNTNNTTSSRNE